MFKVSSISVIIGFARDSTIASTVATNVKTCVITSSFFFKSNAAKATLKADVPDVTAKEYFEMLNYEVYFFPLI